MPFKKGQSGNEKGRPKGAENKERKALREAITLFIEDNYDRFKEELLKLRGREFVDRIISLLEYSTPKLNRTDLTNDGERFDFSIFSDAELINELKQLTKSISGKESDSK